MTAEISIIPWTAGYLMAQAIEDDIVVRDKLPHGFQNWTIEECEAHMKRFTGPRLFTLMQKAKLEHVKETLEKTEQEAKEMGAFDIISLQRADAKRARRAANRAKLGPQVLDVEHTHGDEPA